jgi:FecR protein
MNTATRHLKPLAWALALALVGLLLALAAMPALAQGESVAAGEITLAIGQARIERAQASLAEPRKGDAIQSGDVISTASNGHIHIRFIDGARISVRPNSVFRIQEFRYDPVQPAASVIRFTLDSGEVRSISGAAAHAARDRFRLNTPLVAIGVKGTDFLTQVSPQATRVTVNEGAIVMAPIDLNCRADGLGVCGGAFARELRADMAGQVLIYQRGAVEPGLQSLPARSDGDKLNHLDRQLKDGKDGSAQSLRATTDTREARDPLALISASSRLLWGRWANTAVPGDTLTTPFLEAMRGNDITIGDGYYFLFREPGVANLLPSLNSKVNFSLQSSSAYYRTPSNDIVAASVLGGSLGIDFASRTYATSLSLSAQGVPAQTFGMSGSVNTNTGVFLGGSGGAGGNTATLAGALSLDAGRAGYQFKVPVGIGSISGATLWGRQP